MKILKCKKSISGNHKWIQTRQTLKYVKNDLYCGPRGPFHPIVLIKVRVKRKYPICKYCGMIDDIKK